MYLADTQTCGVKEITGLLGGNTITHLNEFCQKHFGKSPVFKGCDYHNKDTVYCFYLFTQGAGNYSGKFADYIEANGLGKVVRTARVKNDAFHPEHSNQAFLWSPSVPNLQKWYKLTNEEKQNLPFQPPPKKRVILKKVGGSAAK